MALHTKNKKDAINFERCVKSSFSLLLQGHPSQEASNNSPVVFT